MLPPVGEGGIKEHLKDRNDIDIHPPPRELLLEGVPRLILRGSEALALAHFTRLFRRWEPDGLTLETLFLLDGHRAIRRIGIIAGLQPRAAGQPRPGRQVLPLDSESDFLFNDLDGSASHVSGSPICGLIRSGAEGETWFHASEDGHYRVHG